MCESEELVESKRKLSNFVEEMKKFPCSFNLGQAIILDAAVNIRRPILKDDAWLFLKKHLNDADDDDDVELVPLMWKQNFLVRVHTELHDARKSLKLCTDLVQMSPDNMVACANLAFVYLLKGDVSMAENQLQIIKEIQFSEEARLEALADQCYMYYKISGDDENLISGTELIKYVLRFRPGDNNLRLMLAVLYRRLSRFKRYIVTDQSAYRKDYVAKAVTELQLVRAESSSRQIEAVAIIELALLKNDNKLFDESEKIRLFGEESVENLCRRAIDLTTTSSRVLTTAGQILLSMHELTKAEEIITKVMEERTCPRMNIYLGWVYTYKAVRLQKGFKHFRRETVDFRKIFLTKQEVQLITLLTDVTHHILFFSDDNPDIKQALNVFKICVKMDYCEAEMLRKIALKFMQCRDYITALSVCEKLLMQDRSCAQKTFCHSVMYHMAAICCSQIAFTLEDAAEQRKLCKRAEELILLSIRVMASIALKESHPGTRDDLWKWISRTPKIQEMKLENFQESSFECLCRLVAYYMHAIPVLWALVNKTQDSWMDIDAVERNLKDCEAQGLTKALLYLDFLKLKGYNACQRTWQNSSMVRNIKLKAAEKVLRHHRADDKPDSIWQEIFNEEYELDINSKWAPLSRLDALLELKTYDVVIVGSEDQLTRQVVECLKDILGQVCGMLVLDVAELPSLEQQSLVTCSAHVVIFVTSLNRPFNVTDENIQSNKPMGASSQKSKSNQSLEPSNPRNQSKQQIESGDQSSQSDKPIESSNQTEQLNHPTKPVTDLQIRFDSIKKACKKSYDYENSPKQILNLFTGPFSTQGCANGLVGHQILPLTSNDLRAMSLLSPVVNTFTPFTVEPSSNIVVVDDSIDVNDRPASTEPGKSGDVSSTSIERGRSGDVIPACNDPGGSGNVAPDSATQRGDSNVNSDESVKVVMKIFKGIIRQLPNDM